MKKIADENQALYREHLDTPVDAKEIVKEKKDTKKGAKEV